MSRRNSRPSCEIWVRLGLFRNRNSGNLAKCVPCSGKKCGKTCSVSNERPRTPSPFRSCEKMTGSRFRSVYRIFLQASVSPGLAGYERELLTNYTVKLQVVFMDNLVIISEKLAKCLRRTIVKLLFSEALEYGTMTRYGVIPGDLTFVKRRNIHITVSNSTFALFS